MEVGSAADTIAMEATAAPTFSEFTNIVSKIIQTIMNS
jgi:hypothetical protein